MVFCIIFFESERERERARESERERESARDSERRRETARDSERQRERARESERERERARESEREIIVMNLKQKLCCYSKCPGSPTIVSFFTGLNASCALIMSLKQIENCVLNATMTVKH